MRKLRRFFAHWLVSSFIAIAILSAIIWFVGDLLELGTWRPFGSETTQIIVIAVLFTLWFLMLGIWAWRRHRRNKSMVEEIVAEAPDPTAEAMTAEQSEVQSKFNTALRELAKLRFKSRLGGSRYLYELPWYIFIGPPGAGKTTALEKCGLEFPRRRSGEPISIADTRNIEWIFTNEAVFIDTAGRYTTQDSNRTIDSSSWRKLLDLIAQKRPGEPINGVIVAISISELATADPGQIIAHAEAVRDRLTEICEKMRARVPVYLMFTKADLLVGFNEFFQTMSKAEREQVWGMTYPLKGGVPARDRIARDIDRFEGDFDLLVERLGEMQFPLIQQEIDIENRAKIFGFASQFSSLKPVISRFLRETFRPDKWNEAILLRGFYFSSATQVGQPVDRLISTMSREFGLERRVVDALTGDTGRSYFLGGLLRNVIFPEAGLVAAARKARRALMVARYGVLAVCIAVPVAFGIGWWTVESHMDEQAAQLADTLVAYEGDLATFDVTPVADDDLELIATPLNRLRDEMTRLSDEAQDPPLLGLGISAMGDLRRQSEIAYHQGLEDLMRPRLLYRLEGLIDNNLHQPDRLYDILKAYLMIGGRGPMDEGYIQAFTAVDWEDRYPYSLNQDLIDDLSAHLDTLLTIEPDRDMELNEEAISRARTAISQITLAERAYSILKSAPEVRALRPWTVTDAGGAIARDVFTRASGADLDKPIPGLFTYEGFWGLFISNADDMVEAALEEKWVLSGDGADVEPTRAEITRTREEIRTLYYTEYIEVWQDLLNDLRIVPFRDAEHAANTLTFLSANNSPLERILRAVVYNTSIAEQPAEDSAILAEAGKIAFHRFSSRFRNAARLAEAGTSQQGGRPTEGQVVQDAFTDLREYLGRDRSSGEMGQTMAYLEDLYNAVSDMQRNRGEDLSVLSQQPPAIKLERQIRRAPRAVSRMIGEMLTQADAATVGGIKAQLNEIWRSTIAPQCRQRLHGRYPFGSGPEVAFGDLAAILGHDGLIDDFYKRRLASMVDDSVSPWRWRSNIGASLGIPNNRLDFFEKAAQLRDAFFPGGRPSPELGFDVSVYAWHPNVAVARFAVGGAEAAFLPDQEGGARQYRMNWPGLQSAAGAEVEITRNSGSSDLLGNALPGEAVTVGESGTWGLFKLIGKSGFKTFGAGDIVRMDVNADGGRLFLQLKMDSATNPLKLRDVIRGFKCPPGF